MVSIDTGVQGGCQRFLAFFLWVCLAKAQTPSGTPNILTPAEKAAGWQLLFDGKSLIGWDARVTSGTAVGDWSVQNGAIVCPGLTPGWLATSSTFNNFHLTLEFRGSERVNSGVFLRSQKKWTAAHHRL